MNSIEKMKTIALSEDEAMFVNELFELFLFHPHNEIKRAIDKLKGFRVR